MRWLVLLTLACCGPTPHGDAEVDARVPGCAGTDFAAPQHLDGLVGGGDDPSASGDALELWFSRTGIVPTYDIAGARRMTPTASFDTALDFPHNTTASERDPALSADGLVMMFISDRDGTMQVFESRRASTEAAFDAPVLIQLPGHTVDNGIELSADGLTLYFADATGELRSTSRPSRAMPFAATSEVLAAGIRSPSLSADELELFYSRTDTVAAYRRTRASTSAVFDKEAEKLVLNDAVEPDVSVDGTRLYIKIADLWVLSRTCD